MAEALYRRRQGQDSRLAHAGTCLAAASGCRSPHSPAPDRGRTVRYPPAPFAEVRCTGFAAGGWSGFGACSKRSGGTPVGTATGKACVCIGTVEERAGTLENLHARTLAWCETGIEQSPITLVDACALTRGRSFVPRFVPRFRIGCPVLRRGSTDIQRPADKCRPRATPCPAPGSGSSSEPAHQQDAGHGHALLQPACRDPQPLLALHRVHRHGLRRQRSDVRPTEWAAGAGQPRVRLQRLSARGRC